MSLVIATGSNIGDRENNLLEAQHLLQSKFKLIAKSRIYESAAVDYKDQPAFYNQVLEFEVPEKEPELIMNQLLEIEKAMGRSRDIKRGPRNIDIDIIFWGNEKINLPNLTVPHPRWNQRSFVVAPLSELPFFQTLKKCFTIPNEFDVPAFPIEN
jgi:2-amino-4-hydroxy-6-hydroxymethyldihydropteridine diphosphokinase